MNYFGRVRGWGSRLKPQSMVFLNEFLTGCNAHIPFQFFVGLSRNLFRILHNTPTTPTVVGIMCKGHSYESSIYALWIETDVRIYIYIYIFAVEEVGDVNV